MNSKIELGTRAVQEATRLRARLGIESTAAICPFDMAADLGVVVRLHALPSLEGIYSPEEKSVVILSSERPWGRIRHTCAHELGHHVFGHGASIDEPGLNGHKAWKPEEFMADRFATGLLMPKLAVMAAVERHGWNVAKLSAEQAFVLAQEFGVGYTNFISHLERTLKVMDPRTAQELRRNGLNLKRIRNAVAGFDVAHDVFVGDEHWGARPIDIETGDIVVIPPNALFCGHCARMMHEPIPHLLGVTAGEGRLNLRSRSSALHVRVSQRGFTGLARYRHMDEFDDE
ncbi:MAG: ImmA/IrrE family metallo-endopeptidase [Gammaproteobacteria bacterium]|nr:ImmA/IrrE family metallo-endopeptidase [Gammaproteobacteria bacterium]